MLHGAPETGADRVIDNRKIGNDMKNSHSLFID
jgi:hypothetical protein